MRENIIMIKTDEAGVPLGDLFGIFFEDLNHAADGGLYAEMVQNRSFEFAPIDNSAYHALTAWEKVGSPVLTVQEGGAVSPKNPHFLHMEAKAGEGVKNIGFGNGMFLEKEKLYLFSCYAKIPKGQSCKVTASLSDPSGRVLASESFSPNSTWQKYTCELTAEETTAKGALMLTISDIPDNKKAGLDLDLVSLFPKDTYRGRKNGLRRDLAEALEELHPKFMRFPGGCLVHDGSLDAQARNSMYRWKNTLGPVADRPARRSNWGYNQTLGLGYYEYFQLCEDIGAKPVPILPAAYNPHHQRMAPLAELDPWIQETLDLIEFANGDETTQWGALRASLGHKAPFGLEYLGIGNEEVGEGFRQRFPYFVRAIREKYPEIKIIGSSGPFCSGSEYQLGWECARETGADIVDEHYYASPEWFIENIHRCDSFSADGPYVFLGEYATWGNTGRNALTEAAFMTQLQNSAHAVKMACYAPLFCNKNYVNWKPDMIWFDSEKVCRSVNYEVQKLFMNHQGDVLLECILDTPSEKELLLTLEERKQGGILFMGDETQMTFTDIVLYDEDSGKNICFPDIEALPDQVPVCLLENGPQNFRLKFHAKELDGYKGFRLYFNWKNKENHLAWVLGGWENQDGTITENVSGRSSTLTQTRFEMERGREYHCELRVSGNRIEGWIDGELFQRTELAPLELEPLYATASRDNKSGDIILKAVNLLRAPFDAKITLPDTALTQYACESWLLQESDCTESPDFPGVETARIIHTDSNIVSVNEKSGFTQSFPERSVTVLRLKGLDV